MSSADDECVLCDTDSVRDLWYDADLTWYQCHQCSDRLRKTRYLVCQGCKRFHTTCLFCKAAVDNSKYEAYGGHGNLQAPDHHSRIPALSQGPYQDTGFQDIGSLIGDDDQGLASQPWPLAPPGHFAPELYFPQQYFSQLPPQQQYLLSHPLSPEFILGTLCELRDHLEPFADYWDWCQNKNVDREAREAGTMHIVLEIPVEMQQRLSDLCYAGCNMAEHLAREDSGWGANVLQKLLVLTQASEKQMLIQQLTKRSGYMIYSPSMCYVASQIIMEAEISPAGSGVAEAAHSFFMTAHANSKNFRVTSAKNLLKSMQHLHANYSFQEWVTFLGKSSQQDHKDVMLLIVDVAQANLQTLLLCPIGCRILLRLFETDFCQVSQEGHALARACTTDGGLTTYAFNKYANHCIQSVIAHFHAEWPEVSRLIVGEKFEDILFEEHANYVLKAFICSKYYKKYLLQLAEKFLKIDLIVMPEQGCPKNDEVKVRKLVGRWKGIGETLADKMLEFRSGKDWYPWRDKANELRELVKERYEIYSSRFPEFRKPNERQHRSSKPMHHEASNQCITAQWADWVEG